MRVKLKNEADKARNEADRASYARMTLLYFTSFSDVFRARLPVMKAAREGGSLLLLLGAHTPLAGTFQTGEPCPKTSQKDVKKSSTPPHYKVFVLFVSFVLFVCFVCFVLFVFFVSFVLFVFFVFFLLFCSLLFSCFICSVRFLGFV